MKTCNWLRPATKLLGAGIMAVSLASPLLAAEGEAPAASITVGAQFLDIEAQVDFERATLRIAGPDGYALTRGVSIEEGSYITADLVLDAEPVRMHGNVELQRRDALPDGIYRYEVEFQAADGSIRVVNGTFRVDNGTAYELQREVEEVNEDGSISSVGEPGILGRMAGAVVDFVFPSAHATTNVDDILQIYDTDDNGHSRVFFQSDTVDTPPSNWWLHNQDGSMFFREYPGSGSFERVTLAAGGNVGIGTTSPQDQLHINDSGGFQIRMTTGSYTTRLDSWSGRFAIYGNNGNQQFSLNGGAPTDSMAIDASGNVALGAAAAAQKLHVVSPQVSTRLRIDPTGSTWDLWAGAAGLWLNEEDSATQPFKIDNGSATDSLVIRSSGNIGMGTASPDAALHLIRSNNTAQIRVQDTGTSSPQVLFSLIKAGFPQFQLQNTAQPDFNWTFRLAGNSGSSERFEITKIGTGAAEFELYADGSANFRGDVTANGVLLTSTREAKTDFRELDERDVLDKLASLEISQWRYKDEEAGTTHIGPIAEEFHEVFGLSDGKRLNMIDTNGIAFAAIQALNTENETLKAENRQIKDRLAALEQSLLD